MTKCKCGAIYKNEREWLTHYHILVPPPIAGYKLRPEQIEAYNKEREEIKDAHQLQKGANV